jgi:hypothetical protein
MMLLPQLHGELTRAACAKPVARRAGGRAVGALVAACAALLVAAPAAQGELALVGPPLVAPAQLEGQ